MGKRDLWLIGGLLLLTAALFLSSWLLGRPGAYAVVRVDGREVARYALTQKRKRKNFYMIRSVLLFPIIPAWRPGTLSAI